MPRVALGMLLMLAWPHKVCSRVPNSKDTQVGQTIPNPPHTSTQKSKPWCCHIFSNICAPGQPSYKVILRTLIQKSIYCSKVPHQHNSVGRFACNLRLASWLVLHVETLPDHKRASSAPAKPTQKRLLEFYSSNPHSLLPHPCPQLCGHFPQRC